MYKIFLCFYFFLVKQTNFFLVIFADYCVLALYAFV